MAATKLNPAAPPFPCPYPVHHPGTPQPAMLQYHAGACPPGNPVSAFYCCTQFPVPYHYHPFIQFPVLHPSPILRKADPAQPAPFLRKGGVPTKAARLLRKGIPTKAAGLLRRSVPELRKKILGKAEPEHDLPEDVGEPAPHGLPPHKLMATGGAKKVQAAAEAQVTKDAVTACRQEPATDATDQMPAARTEVRVARRKAERRSRNKTCKERAVVGPRARTRPRPSTWTLSCKFTTRRLAPLPKKPPAGLGECTTVMIRNIPNRIKSVEMIALLDEHCARANRAAGSVVAAYDVVYLPMDFRLRGNYGYAFVNFTTGDATLGLYYSLQGCGWKVCGSSKIIAIVPAKIQGKEALVRHLSRQKFECASEEYLPVVFSPPRDGGALTTATTTTRVGKLTPGPPAARLRVKKKAYARVGPKVGGKRES